MFRGATDGTVENIDLSFNLYVTVAAIVEGV